MKKIFLCIGIIILLSGCGNEEMMTTCTTENTYNGLTSGTEYLITYQDDEVRHVTITYNYNQEDHIDGVNTGTDGTTEDENVNDDNEIIDGVVGDTIDDIIGGVYDTILDISGIRDRHTNQINNTNIEGFTTSVEDNTNTSYKIIYDIDLTKISDENISRFNVDRSYETLIDNYTNQGLTCK